MTSEILVNTDSGNGLLPDGTKPLPEPQITNLAVVYSIVYSDADERKHQSSMWLAFVRGIHRDRWIPRTKGQ